MREGGYDANLARLSALVQDALTACTRPDGSLLILNWLHESYRLRPHMQPTEMFLHHALETQLRPGWPLGRYPNGDYHILIAEDFRYGTFGHPWEQTLCLFGADLLTLVANEITGLLGSILRRSGRPTTAD